MKTYVHFWPRSDWVENSKAAFIITVMLGDCGYLENP
jgi:hypothetical protein